MCSMRHLLVWLLAAVCAAAEIVPGTSRGLPCPGTDETYDLFIPRVYLDEPERRFPVLFVSDPGGHPHWHGLEPWAERQGVVMVTINGSRNGPWEPILAAQKAITETVFATYRIHPSLRFAMGFSGGAWASTVLAARFKDDWAGVVLCGHGHGRRDITAKHVMLGYHMGRQDAVYSFASMQRAAAADRDGGMPVRVIEREVGHVWAGTPELEELLDWMLEQQRLAHPRLPAAERRANLERLAARAGTAATLADPAERRAALERILAIGPAGTQPELKPAREAWLAAVLASVDDQADPVAAWRALSQAAASPWQAGIAGPARKELGKRLETLQRRKEVKPEAEAAQALAQVAAAEARKSAGASVRQQLIANYQAIAKRWPGTEAAAAAEAAAERLAARP